MNNQRRVLEAASLGNACSPQAMLDRAKEVGLLPKGLVSTLAFRYPQSPPLLIVDCYKYSHRA